MLLYYIPTFWENFHTELSTPLGKFSHKLNTGIKSMGIFSQKIFFNKRSDKNRQLYLLIRKG